jgi:uncharacterized protein (DUF4415 family)
MPTWENAHEDVNNLDDEDLIEACLGLGSDSRAKPSGARFAQWDWPPEVEDPRSVEIDADILTWFRARSGAWRKVINAVLRGWIEASSKDDTRSADV